MKQKNHGRFLRSPGNKGGVLNHLTEVTQDCKHRPDTLPDSIHLVQKTEDHLFPQTIIDRQDYINLPGRRAVASHIVMGANVMRLLLWKAAGICPLGI